MKENQGLLILGSPGALPPAPRRKPPPATPPPPPSPPSCAPPVGGLCQGVDNISRIS